MKHYTESHFILADMLIQQSARRTTWPRFSKQPRRGSINALFTAGLMASMAGTRLR